MLGVLPHQENPGERLFDFPSERLIAAGRIFLALFALIAVAIETVSANQLGHATFAVLAAYLGFALLQGILVLRRLPSPREQPNVFAKAALRASPLLLLSPQSRGRGVQSVIADPRVIGGVALLGLTFLGQQRDKATIEVAGPSVLAVGDTVRFAAQVLSTAGAVIPRASRFLGDQRCRRCNSDPCWRRDCDR